MSILANLSVQNGEELLNEIRYQKLASEVLKKRQLRGSVPNFKDKGNGRSKVKRRTLRRDQKVIFVKSPISSPIVMPAPAEELKKNQGQFMLKIPDVSLVPCLCKQARLDLVSAWKYLDPCTLYQGLYARPSPFWHAAAVSLRSALRWSYLKANA